MAASQLLVAVYSAEYVQSRACQWELATAHIAALRLGDVTDRLLVVNPEAGVDHILPAEVRDASVLSTAAPDWLDQLVRQVEERARRAGGTCFGTLATTGGSGWIGRKPVAATEMVERPVLPWRLHGELNASRFPMTARRSAVGPDVVQITGMPGCGKTWLLEEYAWRFQLAYPGGVYYLSASGAPSENESTHRSALESLCGQIPLEAPPDAPTLLLESLIRQHIDKAGERVLWIVDGLPTGLSAEGFRLWLCPSSNFGATAITTQSQEHTRLAPTLVLDSLTPHEGLELLTVRREPTGAIEQQAAEDIITRLGGHPQSIDVVGHYLAATAGIRSFKSVADQLAGPSNEILQVAARFADSLPTGRAPDIVAAVAAVIRGQDPEAARVLAVMAVASPLPVTARFITDIVEHDDSVPDAGAEVAEGLRGLRSASLARCLSSEEGIWICHEITARVFASLDENRVALHRSAHAIAEGVERFLQGQRSPAVQAPHHPAEDLAYQLAVAASAVLGEETPPSLLVQLGVYLQDRGRLEGAEEFFRAVVVRHEVSGSDYTNQSYTAALSNLAWVLASTGRASEAIPLQRELLAFFEEDDRYGRSHPDAVNIRANLASSHRFWGRYEEAIALDREVVQIRAEEFGETDPKTLTVKGNLAGSLWEGGRRDEAIELEEEILRGRTTELGESHPETIRAMNALAGSRHQLGDAPGARVLYAKTFHWSRRHYTDSHPFTWLVASNIANVMAQDPAHGELAMWLSSWALDQQTQYLGTRHDATLSTMASLARMAMNTGDLDRAERLYRECVIGRTRTLGATHPYAIAAVDALAKIADIRGDVSRRDALIAELRRRGA